MVDTSVHEPPTAVTASSADTMAISGTGKDLEDGDCPQVPVRVDSEQFLHESSKLPVLVVHNGTTTPNACPAELATTPNGSSELVDDAEQMVRVQCEGVHPNGSACSRTTWLPHYEYMALQQSGETLYCFRHSRQRRRRMSIGMLQSKLKRLERPAVLEESVCSLSKETKVLCVGGLCFCSCVLLAVSLSATQSLLLCLLSLAGLCISFVCMFFMMMDELFRGCAASTALVEIAALVQEQRKARAARQQASADQVNGLDSLHLHPDHPQVLPVRVAECDGQNDVAAHPATVA